MSKGTPGVRYAEIDRETPDTRVQVVLDLDGGGKQDIATGIDSFDRMLELFGRAGHLNLGVQVECRRGPVDHQVLEDVGLAIGKAIRESLVDSESIRRRAGCSAVRADAFVTAAMELGGRGQAYLDLGLASERLGDLSTQSIGEFFQCLALYGAMTLHVRKLAGTVDQHVCDAAFKAVGDAIHQATRPEA